MNVNKLYDRAEKAYDAKKYDVALKILKDIQKISPTYRFAYYLESFIWKKRKNPVKEYQARQQLLPFLDTSSPEEKNFSAQIFSDMGLLCNTLCMSEQACKYYYLSAVLTSDENLSAYSISNALLCANSSEYFTDTDFHAIYDEFKKVLSKIKPCPKKFYNHKKNSYSFFVRRLQKSSRGYVGVVVTEQT